MSDTHTVAPGDGTQPVAPVITPADTQISASEAARNLANRRWESTRQPKEDEPSSAEPGEPAEQELAPQGDSADPPQEAPGETQATEPAELPPIEPPRSWTKDEQERFQTYPRELQAYLSEREQERDRDLRRRQNEAAELQKQIKAEQEAVARQRQEYETAIPQVLMLLQHKMAGEFADIQTPADLQKMAAEDPARYIRWDAAQKEIAQAQEVARQAQQRQQQEALSQWKSFVSEQEKLVLERIPEIADPEKGPKIKEAAVRHLEKLGANMDVVMAAWNGQGGISPQSAWFQELLYDSMKFREAKAAVAKPTPKPVPPVQRPGVVQPRGAAQDASIQALSQQLEQTGSLRAGAALLAAKRAARR